MFEVADDFWADELELVGLFDEDKGLTDKFEPEAPLDEEVVAPDALELDGLFDEEEAADPFDEEEVPPDELAPEPVE